MKDEIEEEFDTDLPGAAYGRHQIPSPKSEIRKPILNLKTRNSKQNVTYYCQSVHERLMGTSKNQLSKTQNGVFNPLPYGRGLEIAIFRDCLMLLPGFSTLTPAPVVDMRTIERLLRRADGRDTGGRTAAILFTITQSAKRHDLNVFNSLKDILARISDHRANQFHPLLPDT